jgi:mannose-6-phosphate isomerase
LEPSTGDCLFLPSGRIHAIGAGLLIYEIQQNSDTTYRVFDWNRVGLDGEPRPLHVRESLRSIDFTDTHPQMQTVSADGVLVRCGYFEVKIRHAGNSFALGTEGEHLTFAVVRGAFTCGGETWRAGDFGLVPASLTAADRAVMSPSFDAAWLEVRLP